MATEPDAATARFGDLVRRYRLAAGPTQDQLAERAGLSKRGISDLERGARTRPQRETIHLLVDALGLSGAKRPRSSPPLANHPQVDVSLSWPPTILFLVPG
jgi:transcriptional regulator with XRE-family HTH domain